MIILTVEDNAFDNVHHPFLVKSSDKLKINGTCLNMVRAMEEKPR